MRGSVWSGRKFVDRGFSDGRSGRDGRSRNRPIHLRFFANATPGQRHGEYAYGAQAGIFEKCGMFHGLFGGLRQLFDGAVNGFADEFHQHLV